MVDNIEELFEEIENDNTISKDFGKVENKLSRRPDLCGLLILDKLLPKFTSIIASAEHDQIWLSINVKELAEVATKNNIVDLIRCGIYYNSAQEALTMDI